MELKCPDYIPNGLWLWRGLFLLHILFKSSESNDAFASKMIEETLKITPGVIDLNIKYTRM